MSSASGNSHICKINILTRMNGKNSQISETFGR